LLISIDHGADWESRARCRGSDPTLFFGPNRFEPKRERLQREATAKEICARCPAVLACREYALAHGEAYGVWGGLGEAERRAVIAEREALMARRAV
jgi:WhiB family transcriptional regulator, redox-sensing transcriptional regulator